MLSERRAAWLAALAVRRRRDGSGGPLASRAWRRLTEAADHGNHYAIDAVWRAWRGDPRDDLWAALNRWRNAETLAQAAFSAAMAPERDPAARAAIGRFCARHDLAPGDEVQRVLFYELTGQHAQRRAADPGGSVLSMAYREAEPRTRAAILEAVTSAGDLEVVRVVAEAGRRDHAARMTREEGEYLSRDLARRRDHAGLWHLAQRLPLADAVAAVRLIGDGWCPPDGAGLFDLLRRARPEAVAAQAAAAVIPVRLGSRLRGFGSSVLGVVPDMRQVCDVSFSPDGSEIAVAVRSWGVAACSLPSGRLVRHYEIASPQCVVHLGEWIVDVEYTSRNWPRWPEVWVIWRRRRDQGRGIFLKAATVGGEVLIQVPGGFLLTDGGHLWSGGAVGLHEVMVNDSFPPLREVMPGFPGRVPVSWRLDNLTAEPLTGRLAVRVNLHRCGCGLVVLDPDFGVIAQASGREADQVYRLAFCGPDRLLTEGLDGVIRSWRVGPPLVAEAAIPARGGCWPVPGSALVGIRGDPLEDAVRWLSARTLATVAGPPGLGSARHIWASPGGEYVAVVRAGVMEVHDLRLGDVARLLTQPLADARPADLAVVRAAADRDVGPGAKQVIDLLRACLEYQFGTELAIGGAGVAAARADDIGLGRGQPC